MVKPITKETLFMNCMELDFATKVELEHWMATFEEKVMPKALASYTIKSRNNRGVIFYDYRS